MTTIIHCDEYHCKFNEEICIKKEINLNIDAECSDFEL